MQAVARPRLDLDETLAASPTERLCMLLIVLLAMLICVELSMRGIHDRRKATLDIEHGIQDALLIRQRSGLQQILVAGNSLIYDDISRSDLQQSLGSGYLVHTAGVPGSTYYDWQYGLTSLMGRGSQPDFVVFSISPSQFLRSAAVTPLPVSMLWRMRELLNYSRTEHSTLTVSSELLFEHYSSFFYMRDTVRLFLRKSIPGYREMVEGWNSVSPIVPVENEVTTEADFADRLSRLQIACGPHARLVLLIAPTRQHIDESLEARLRSAAKQLNIPVVEPVGEEEWPTASFRDGYHLTSPGAQEFSKLVARDLLPIVRRGGPKQ